MFTSFGYNAVVEVTKRILDKLLDAQIYDRNFVPTDGKLSDEEYRTFEFSVEKISDTVDLCKNEPDIIIQLYTRIGSPTIAFDPDHENCVNIRVPIVLAPFLAFCTGEVTFVERIDDLAVGVDRLPLVKLELARTDDTGAKTLVPGLGPDLASLAADQMVVVKAGEVLNDDELDALLTRLTYGAITGSALRALVAEKLHDLGPLGVEIPTAGEKVPTIANWDFRLVSGSYKGFDLLLYHADGSGKGLPSDAGNTIPQDAEPEYEFAISLNAEALLDFMDRALDLAGYYRQGYSTSLNTPDDPYGFMEVSSSNESLTYTLPALPGDQDGVPPTTTECIVGPPVKESLEVSIPPGGLAPGCAATLRNLSTNIDVGFTAESDGSKTVSIAAQGGHHLGVWIQKIPAPEHSNVLIGRPRFSLENDRLWIEDDWEAVVDLGVDQTTLTGTAKVWLELSADRSGPFKMKARVLDSDLGEPRWVTLLPYLALLLGGTLVSLVGTIALVLGSMLFLGLRNLVGGLLRDAEAKLGTQIKERVGGLQLPLPGGEQLAIFLDQVDLYEDGIVWSGYADAGLTIEYGRTEVAVLAGEAELGETSKIPLTWEPDRPNVSITLADPHSFSGGDSKNFAEFWNADYRKGARSNLGTAVVTLARDPGFPTFIWVDHGRESTDRADGITKILLQRDEITNEQENRVDIVRATWVTYPRHAVSGVVIKPEVTATQAKQQDLGNGAEERCFRYDASLRLETTKFFRTTLTREAGFEKWYSSTNRRGPWTEIPREGVVEPGIRIDWVVNATDAAQDRLVVSVDQVDLPPQERIAELFIAYAGADAFGMTTEQPPFTEDTAAVVRIEIPTCQVDGSLRP